jgi:hypothetical protein
MKSPPPKPKSSVEPFSRHQVNKDKKKAAAQGKQRYNELEVCMRDFLGGTVVFAGPPGVKGVDTYDVFRKGSRKIYTDVL